MASGKECDLIFHFLSFGGQGRNADALALYFGEDPARCPFEQGMLCSLWLCTIIFYYIFIRFTYFNQVKPQFFQILVYLLIIPHVIIFIMRA